MTCQPNNVNFLTVNNFKFNMSKTPVLNYTAQTVTIPQVNLGSAIVPTPFVKAPMSGNFDFGDFSVTFRVTEDLSNYKEIFNWMSGLGYPVSTDQYKNLLKDSIKSDATVILLNSSLSESASFKFIDCFPVSLSQIYMDSTKLDVEYATAQVTFKYLRFEIE